MGLGDIAREEVVEVVIAPFGLVGVDRDDRLQRSQRGPVAESNKTVRLHAPDGPDVALNNHPVLFRFWLPPEALGNRQAAPWLRPLKWFVCLSVRFLWLFFETLLSFFGTLLSFWR